MSEAIQKTKFRLVMPSAQLAVPVLERRARLFLEDGTEIHGLRLVSMSGGEPNLIDTGTWANPFTSEEGLRSEVTVDLRFTLDQFTIER